MLDDTVTFKLTESIAKSFLYYTYSCKKQFKLFKQTNRGFSVFNHKPMLSFITCNY